MVDKTTEEVVRKLHEEVLKTIKQSGYVFWRRNGDYEQER
jgi:hypothetical protein